MVIRLHKKVFLLLLTVIWLTCLILFLYWQDNGLTVTRSEYRSPSVPRGFDGFTVVQLSDLHNKQFGKEQKALLDTLAALSPDAIFLTGDLIDRRRYDLDTAIKLVEGAVKLAPVYYVSGNHEVLSGHYDEILERLQAAGVHTLENEETSLTADCPISRRPFWMSGHRSTIFCCFCVIGRKCSMSMPTGISGLSLPATPTAGSSACP